MFNQQIQEIKNDYDKSCNFFEKIDNFLNQYKDLNQPKDEINAKTQSLVSSMIQEIILRDEVLENKLLIFEAEFHAQLLIKNQEPIDKWLGLCKYSEQLNIQNESLEWFSTLKSQIYLYNEYKQMIESLKQQELQKNNPIQYQKFISFQQKMMSSLMIDIDKQYIDNLSLKSKRALQFYQEIINSNPKQIISQFKKAELNFKQLPFLFQEEKAIKLQLQNYQDLQNTIEKSKQYVQNQKPGVQVDQKLSQAIMESYDQCKIYNADAHKIKQIYENAQQILDDVVLAMNNELSFEQIYKLSLKLDQIQINLGSKHEEIILNLWMQKVNLLKNKPKLHYKQLNSFLKEGYQLLILPQNILRIKNFILFLEDEIIKVEKILEQLNQIKQPQKIDEFQQNIQNLKYDITEEIIEYKTNLNYNKYFLILNESCVKQPYSKFQGNLTDTQGLVKFLQEEKQIQPKLLENLFKQKQQIQVKKSVQKIMKPEGFKNEDEIPIIKKIAKNQQDNIIPQPSQNVSEQLRRNIKIELYEIMRKNMHFPSSIKSHVQIVENDVFGKYYNNSYKYTNELNIYKQFFKNLLKFPNISQIIVQRNFSLDSLKKVYNKELSYLQQLELKNQQKKALNEQNEQKKQIIKQRLKNKQQTYDPLNMPFIEQTKSNQNLKEITQFIMDDDQQQQYKVKPKNDRLQQIISDKQVQNKNTYNIFDKSFEDQPTILKSSQNEKAEFSDDVKEPEEIKIEYKNNDIQDLLYDPESGICNGQIKKKEKDIPQGSILQIFDGKIQFNDVYSINLLSCEDIQKINKFPKITSNFIKVLGKLDLHSFLEFIKQYRQVFISGWVQACNEQDFENIEQMANKFLNTNKVGGLKYGKYCSIHLLHYKQISQIKDLINLKLQYPLHLPQNLNQKHQSMIFIITTKSGPFTGEDLNQPKMIQKYDKEHQLIDPFKKLDIGQKDDDIISVITNDDNDKDKNKEDEIDEVMEIFQENNNNILEDQGENEILNQLKNMNEQELLNFISNFDENDKQKIFQMLDIQNEEIPQNNQMIYPNSGVGQNNNLPYQYSSQNQNQFQPQQPFQNQQQIYNSQQFPFYQQKKI